MDLVVKISDKCNFACEFCSSNQIATSHQDLELYKLCAYLEKHPYTRNIIVNGGDPLCTSPEWYYELIKWLKENDRENVHISFTTNLWDFYLHPEKWEDLFKNHISVCTSFQYGTQRKLANGHVFTEELFRKIFNLFEERIGYKLKFIAVVNIHNMQHCIQTVRLAKDLETTCRLNPALRSGRTSEPFPFHVMLNYWLDIIEAGYGEYEDNCKQLSRIWHGKLAECPFNGFCHDEVTGIRCMSPNGEVHICPAIADDILKGIDESYLENSDKIIPFEDTIVKTECPTCRNFQICNSCKKRVKDIHDSNMTDEHCRCMKSLIPRMEKLL